MAMLSKLFAVAFVAATTVSSLAIRETNLTERSVSGFDRFIQIWLENQDFEDTVENGDFQYLASNGILLTNYYALAHPSQPNYVASVGGSLFIRDNEVHDLDQSIPTIVDLLERRGISWATFQEDIPSIGWQGKKSGKYVRKHNPLACYKSVSNNGDRLSNIQGFDSMYNRINSGSFPQWAFITPNLDNDGHDTGLEYGASWSRRFLDSVLRHSGFNGPRTLIVLTYDEGSSSRNNRILTILLGNAVPQEARGTTDDTVYSHYSLLRTVEDNWGLGSLGRGDKDAASFF